MAEASGEPMVPCPKCREHHSASDRECPHCGADLAALPPEGATRRVFLYSALAAGAMGATAVALFWDRIRGIFRGREMVVEYGPPPDRFDSSEYAVPPNRGLRTKAPIEPDPGRFDASEYGVPPDLEPKIEPVLEPALQDPEVRDAHARHRMGDAEGALAAYRKVLARTPPFPQADRIRQWLDDAEAGRPPRD